MKIVERHFVAIDNGITGAVTTLFIVWIVKLGGWAALDEVVKTNRSAFYAASAGVFATAFGFALTAISILLAFVDSPKLAPVRQSRYWRTLWNVFTSSIRCSGFACGASLTAQLADRERAPQAWAATLFVFAATLALLRLYRVVWVFQLIVDAVTQQQIKGPPREIAAHEDAEAFSRS